MTEKGFEYRSELTMNDAEVETARECGDIVFCLIIAAWFASCGSGFCNLVEEEAVLP